MANLNNWQIIIWPFISIDFLLSYVFLFETFELSYKNVCKIIGQVLMNIVVNPRKLFNVISNIKCFTATKEKAVSA